jgi:hypothetical protein
MPSSKPSAMPSVSQQPSIMPTHIETLEASFVANIGLTMELDEEQVEAFSTATADWIFLQDSLTDVVVTVIKQTLLVSSRRLDDAGDGDGDGDGNGDSDGDGDGDEDEDVTGLQIDFEVSAKYTGTDKSFDLFGVLNPFIEGLDSGWLQRVASSDVLFEAIRPAVSSVEFPEGLGASGEGDKKSDSSSNGSGASAAVVTLAIIAAAVAILMGVVASVFSVRQHRVAVYGEELGSSMEPKDLVLSPINSIGDVTVSSPTPSNRSNRSSPYGGFELTQSGKIMQTLSGDCCSDKERERTLSPVSPNSMENGGRNCGANELFNGLPFRPRTSANDGRATQDPPTNSEASFNHQQSYRNKQSLFDVAADQRSEISADSRFMGSQADAFMGSNNNRSAPQYMQHQHQRGGMDSAQADMNHELMLTKSMGGTLGAAAISGGSQASFGSQANSFFSNMMRAATKPATPKAGATAATGNNSRSGAPSTTYSNNGSGNGQGTLGARALGNSNPKQQQQLPDNSSYEAMLRRAGLYDVFAPAGPIGIVVDTTKEGPAVHSLKHTSPMLGLINPGDLIVGLDDQDTRGMTAATLTRLMAKKSSQKERKITLLAMETFY